MSRRVALDIEKELSQRELQLLVHASKGLTDQAIANELAISLATIATYWGRIRIKLGPLNRTELVAKYLDFKSSEEIAGLHNEAQLLREQLETTRDGDSMLLLAMNKLPDAVAVFDEQLIVHYVNEMFCRITGHEPTDYVGKSFYEFYPEGRLERVEAWLKGMMSDNPDPEAAANRNVFVRHSDGNLVELNCNSARYETPDGRRFVVCGRLPV